MSGGTTPASGPERLRAARHAAELTQEQLAHLAGVHVRTVRGLELGAVASPRWDSLDRLATALNLLPQDRPAFFAAWGKREHQLPRPDVFGRGHVADLLDAQARRTAYVSYSETMRIGASRWLEWSETQVALAATADGLDRRYVLVEAVPHLDLDRLRVHALRGCRFVGARPGPHGSRLLELAFDRTLARGETHAFRYAVDHSEARAPGADDEPDTWVGRGFLSPVGSLVLEVQFAAGHVPSRCEVVFQEQPYTERVSLRQLEIDADGRAHIALRSPRMGSHGIRWTW